MSIEQMKKRAKNFSRHLDAHLKRFEDPTSASASLEFAAKLEGYPSWHAALERLRAKSSLDSTGPGAPVLPVSFNAPMYCGSHLKIMNEALDFGCGMIVVGGSSRSGMERTVMDLAAALFKSGRLVDIVRSARSRPTVDLPQSQRFFEDAVAMIDEVRDEASARCMSESAKAGRLVSFPLHVAGVSDMIVRLTSPLIGLKRHELTPIRLLNLLIYQQYLRPLCQHCMLSTQEALRLSTSDDVANACSYVNDTLHLSVESLKWANPAGCPVCRHSYDDGVHANRGAGVLVAEMYRPDHEWLQRTRNGDDRGAYAHFRSFSDGDLLSEDMRGKTIFEHALRRAFGGEMDIRECGVVGSTSMLISPAMPLPGRIATNAPASRMN